MSRAAVEHHYFCALNRQLRPVDDSLKSRRSRSTGRATRPPARVTSISLLATAEASPPTSPRFR